MNAPFFNLGMFGIDIGMVFAVIIGFGFGFTLERAGFGSSRKLAAQFYLYDMTVFKVMFTAIITAMIGIYGLAKIGVLDLNLIWINPTYLWPQIVGGLMLGVGFIISGYCPGTSLVASVSGKIDGMLTVLGVVLGIFIFGLVYTPELAAFHVSGDMGRLTLPELFGIDPMIMTVIVVAFAISAFMVAEWAENKMDKGRGALLDRPALRPSLSYVLLIMLFVAGFIFLVQPAASRPVQAAQTPTATMTPLNLARHIVEGTNNLVILDLRSEAAEEPKEGEEESLPTAIPGALVVTAEQLANPEFWSGTIPTFKQVVLVDEDGTVDEGLTVPAGYQVAWLRGGFAGWKQEILTEPAEIKTEEDRERQALYSWFTGAATKAPSVTAPPPVVPSGGGKKKKITGGC